MSASLPRPQPIRTDTSNDFGHDTMLRRLPGIFRDTAARNPDYPPGIRDALERLASDLESDRPILMLDRPAPDYDDWRAAWEPHAGDTWQNTVWFFAETYAYRQVIQAVRWWETGRDPFAPMKTDEYGSAAPWQLLEKTLAAPGGREDRLLTLFAGALWGNRIDLSMVESMAHGSESVAADDWLVDDRAAVIDHLLRAPGGDVHFINDNTGSELIHDLALAGALLDGLAGRVILHVKLHPTYISDAVPADVLWLVGELAGGAHGAGAAQLGRQLQAAFEAGRLRLAPDLFWNSSRYLWELPPRLRAGFDGARLVIVKGDANYRRMVGDALWPPATPFAEVVGYFPAPVVALRALKSDAVCGLADGLAERLAAANPRWSSIGRYGVVQARLVVP